MPLDLDGFIKLNDAEVRATEAQADNAVKLTQAEINWQQANHAALENLRLLYDIRWDNQAHSQLLRMRNKDLKKLERLRRDREQLSAACMHASWLLEGAGSLERIGFAWQGFNYLRGHLPFAIIGKATLAQPTEAAYAADAWLHPSRPVSGIPESHDAGSLMQWAFQHSCYPKLNGPAWSYIASFMQSLAEAAATAADAKDAIIAKADAEVKALLERDWDRLKRPPPASS